MADRLKGKVAVVTGAARGIGRGIAHKLAAEGAYLVINDYGAELDNTDRPEPPADLYGGGQATSRIVEILCD